MRLRPLWIGVGWMMVAGIVWLSLTSSPPTVDVEQGDKLGHLVGYGTLMFWFSQLYAGRPRLLYAAGFVLMGLVLEYAQGALGYRTSDVFDMFANTLGVVLGWACALIAPRALPGVAEKTRA